MTAIRSSLAAGLAVLALACARDPSAAPAPAAGGAPAVAVVGTTVDLAGVNELVSGGVRFTNELLDQLFLSLLDEQPDWAEHPPTLAPELAESWQLDPDGRTLTLRLRADARWSDGQPVSAEDVRFTWEAQRAPAIAWAYAQSKDGIEAVEVVDAATARFRFRAGYPFQVVDANDGRILPRHAWSALPFERWRTGEEWFRSHLVTSGPFTIAAWTPGQQLVLKRNPHFAPAPPALERVIFRVVPDPAALLERLLAGELDFIDGLSPRDAERLRSVARVQVIDSPTRQFDYLAWNTLRPPFDAPEVRRALTLGIDREALVASLWRGFATVAAGPVPTGVWARDPELAPWPYDPDGARALLAGAGFRDQDRDGMLERDGRPLRFTLLTNAGNRLRADAAVLIRDQLRRIGVAAEPRTVEMSALGELYRRKDFDASLAGLAIDTTLDLRPYFHSAEIAAGWNFVSYRNAEVDRLLDAARRDTDLAAARARLIRVQRILHQEQPYTFLWAPRRLSAATRDLAGIEITHLTAYGTLPRWSRRPRG